MNRVKTLSAVSTSILANAATPQWRDQPHLKKDTKTPAPEEAAGKVPAFRERPNGVRAATALDLARLALQRMARM